MRRLGETNNMTLEQYRQQQMEIAEAQKHKIFLDNMNGKKFSQLTVAQLSYIYKMSNGLYNRLREDKTAIVENIEFYERVAQNNKAVAEAIATQTEVGAEAPQFKLSIDNSLEDKIINQQMEAMFKNVK